MYDQKTGFIESLKNLKFPVLMFGIDGMSLPNKLKEHFIDNTLNFNCCFHIKPNYCMYMEQQIEKYINKYNSIAVVVGSSHYSHIKEKFSNYNIILIKE